MVLHRVAYQYLSQWPLSVRSGGCNGVDMGTYGYVTLTGRGSTPSLGKSDSWGTRRGLFNALMEELLSIGMLYFQSM